MYDEEEYDKALRYEYMRMKAQAEAQRLIEAENGGMFNVLDFAALDSLYTPWLIPGLVPNGIGYMVGRSGIGKSFVAGDLALHIRTGTPWHGGETPQGNVLIVIGEGESSYAERVRAWCDYHGHDLPTVAAGLRFITEARLVSSSQQQELASLVGEFAPVFVLIDTQSTTFGIADEDKNAVLALLLQDLKRNLPGISVMIVHHPSGSTEEGDKPKLRGATAIYDNADFVYSLAEVRGNTPGESHLRLSTKKAHRGKLKNAEEFAIEGLRLTPHAGSMVVVQNKEVTPPTAGAKRVAEHLADGMILEQYRKAAGVSKGTAVADLAAFAVKIPNTKPQQWKKAN